LGKLGAEVWIGLDLGLPVFTHSVVGRVGGLLSVAVELGLEVNELLSLLVRELEVFEER
jgi:hypothetical protein